MEIFKTIDEFRAWRKLLPLPRDPTADVAIKAERMESGKREVGFVPTMGALHAGHMALVDRSRAGNPVTVVSIFVNPLQFGPKEDFSRYPRPFEADAELCEKAGVDAIFAPRREDFYAPDHATYCDVEGLDKHQSGAARPGHFRGVCTVLLKLFHIVQPQRAYFGQKDIQQALFLRRMARDLSLDIEMNIVETVREPSGLALSSRNVYLGPDEKERALAVSRGLRDAEAAWARGVKDAETLRGILRRALEASSPARIDYAEVVSQGRLEPLAQVDGPAVLAVAAVYGKTRLIDNLLLG
jgi:pantoate--beta-alanine ligase